MRAVRNGLTSAMLGGSLKQTTTKKESLCKPGDWTGAEEFPLYANVNSKNVLVRGVPGWLRGLSG